MSELSVWKERIERSEGLQQQQHRDWKDAIDLLNCDYFSKLTGGTDPEFVEVNFAKSYIKKFVNLTYFRDPRIFVESRTGKYTDFADTMDTVINYELKRLRMKKQFKRVILSSALTSPGWIKLGYTAKIGQDVAKIEEEKEKSIIEGLKDTIGGIFRKEKKELTPEEQGILNSFITEENIFASWIPSWNMLMPEGYQVIEQMPYLIEIEEVPKMDFRNNPLYENKKSIHDKRVVRRDTPTRETMNTANYNGQVGGDSELDTIRLYHVWDRREQKRFTMSLEANDKHFEGDWCYDFEGFPYKPLLFEDNLPGKDKTNPYPVNLVKPIMSQIIEKSYARTQMAKWRKRAAAYIIAGAGATDEDIAQITETEAVQLIKVSNSGLFQFAQTPALPQGIFEVDDVIDKDLQMMTSMGQMMFAPQAGTRTATQASIGQSGLQIDMAAAVDTIEDFTVEVATSLAQLAWQFYDRDKIGEILGEEATEKMWIDPPKDPEERRRMIRSQMIFRIDAGSTAPPKDETTDKKQLLDLVSIVMTIAPERIKKGEFVERLLKRFKFAKDLNKIVISSDDDEKQKAQQENQLMLQGHPQTVGPNEPHDVHIQEHLQAAGHPLVDQHIVAHGQKMGIVGKGKGAGQRQGEQQGQVQAGDNRPPVQSTNPEIARQGIPNSAGIAGAARNPGPGAKAGI
jgi:hypothetical protein